MHNTTEKPDGATLWQFIWKNRMKLTKFRDAKGFANRLWVIALLFNIWWINGKYAGKFIIFLFLILEDQYAKEESQEKF